MTFDFDKAFHKPSKSISKDCPCKECDEPKYGVDNPYYQSAKCNECKVYKDWRNSSEHNTCCDCIHYNICYKIEHYGRDLETNIPCKEFIDINDRVEVVRCKDCIHKVTEYDNILTCNVFSNSYGLPYRINPDDFCSRGERRE